MLIQCTDKNTAVIPDLPKKISLLMQQLGFSYERAKQTAIKDEVLDEIEFIRLFNNWWRPWQIFDNIHRILNLLKFLATNDRL
jgi:hypothetical protein